MAEQEEPRSLYNPQDLLFDDYLRVEDVRVNLDGGGNTVEVRAETLPDGVTHWKSLRYHCLPEDAPRAHDVVRVVVVVWRAPPTAEQAGITFKTETNEMPPGPVRVPTQSGEQLAEREPQDV